MKIAAAFCVYNEAEYLRYAVAAILPWVDRVYIYLGRAPYNAYNPAAREVSRPDQTEALVDALAKSESKVAVVKGIWDSEIDHRNAVLEACLKDSVDYYWLVDGDEVYREDHAQRILKEIKERPRVGTFIVKCDIFWRSFSYRIPAEELSWRPRRIFKITPFKRILGVRFSHPLRFTGQNQTNSVGPVYEIPSHRAIFYHFSYARSSAAMADKFKTFSHAHEIKSDWLGRVWDRWPADRQMRDIHPVDPPKFPRAVCKPPEDLPSIMREHPFYALDIIP